MALRRRQNTQYLPYALLVLMVIQADPNTPNANTNNNIKPDDPEDPADLTRNAYLYGLREEQKQEIINREQDGSARNQELLDAYDDNVYDDYYDENYGYASNAAASKKKTSSTTSTTSSASSTSPPFAGTTTSTAGASGPIVHVPPYGSILGIRDQGMDFFGGIPYAAPPVGQLRFAPPEPPPPWAPVVLDGTHYGADCWQLLDTIANPGARRDHMSEDCLSLNVFTPAGHAKKAQLASSTSSWRGSSSSSQHLLLPVMVWLHGGGFQQGGARRPEYDGRRLAERGVIVITLNYRLGALGFLVSSQDGVLGNFGLMDQRAALHWIHDQIGQFGGDPARVTLFGESAGAVMTCQHLMMEGAGTLFQAAILQSNPLGYTFRSVVIADFIGEALKRSVDCRDLECLRAERVEEIMRAQSSLMGLPRSVGDFFTWGPTLMQERNGRFGVGGGNHAGSQRGPQRATSSQPSGRGSGSAKDQDGLLLDWQDFKHHRAGGRGRRGNRIQEAFAVNVSQPLKNMHLIPDDIPVIIGSNKHEGEMFVHSAFPITMSKPVYWMFVGALFKDSAPRVLKHYRGYIEQLEAEAEELAKKQIEEEENKLYYIEHQDQLEREYETLLVMNETRTSKVHDKDYEAVQRLVKSWTYGGAQSYDEDDINHAEQPLEYAVEENGEVRDNSSSKSLKWYNVPFTWPPLRQDTSKQDKESNIDDDDDQEHLNKLGVDDNHSDSLPPDRIRKLLQLAKKLWPFKEEPRSVKAAKAAEKLAKKQAKEKDRALKEAAKVVVDYRPVMSRIIDDYLFRCPSWHYAHKLSGNRVGRHRGQGRRSDNASDSGGGSGSYKDKRTRDNNKVYVYRFSQPTHIPGYQECWGKSCHTSELPYVFQAMHIIRSHYSTVGKMGQREAPQEPEYPYTNILAAFQGALEEMQFEEEDHDDGSVDESSAGDYPTSNIARGGGRNSPNESSEQQDSPSTRKPRTLLNSTSRTRQQQQSEGTKFLNDIGSKAFQSLLKNMFGDYFHVDADEEIAADMAERWVSFAQTGDPNYDGSKAVWLPWRYLPTNLDDYEDDIPWQPEEFEYKDDDFDLEEAEDDNEYNTSTGYRWSENQAERIYRRRALKALGMEVVEEDLYRTELRRMTTQTGSSEMEAVFTFLFGNAQSRGRQQKKQQGQEKMSKRAIRQVQQIAQAMGVVGTGLLGEQHRSGSTPEWDDDFFPEMLELKWPPEGRLVERDCTCDFWDGIRYRY